MGRLTEGMTWRLSDPGMGIMERAGLAALYLSLQAAREHDIDLSPLVWEKGDLTSESVTIRSIGSDEDALLALFRWAWQVREGVLYLPALHDERERDNLHVRLAHHNGILSTFLQHPKVQPKGAPERRFVVLDEGKEIPVGYQTLDPARLKPIADIGGLTRKGSLVEKSIELSGWVFPGIAPRYATEKAWMGPPQIAILLMLAPIACVYHPLASDRSSWLTVIPDVVDLRAFQERRVLLQNALKAEMTQVAGMSDAGLRVLSEMIADQTIRLPVAGCRVVAMGNVTYYPNQKVRKGVVNLTPRRATLARYRKVVRVMGNHWVALKPPEPKKASKGRKPKPGGTEIERLATHFVAIPAGRGRIAENLATGQPWFQHLFEPMPWEKKRILDRKLGESVQSTWFRQLSMQRKRLHELCEEASMWDSDEDRQFVEAFWQNLRALYAREASAVADRGGSRDPRKRWQQLNEELRRLLARATTRNQVRQVLADIFSRPAGRFRSKVLSENPGAVWRLIDADWQRGRDLALLALVSYQSAESDELALEQETILEGETV